MARTWIASHGEPVSEEDLPTCCRRAARGADLAFECSSCGAMWAPEAEPERATTLAERIEVAFDRAHESRRDMDASSRTIRELEHEARMDNLEEWTGAKNNDVRRAIIDKALSDDVDYWQERVRYDTARGMYRLALLEIERLKLLVEAAKAGA